MVNLGKDTSFARVHSDEWDDTKTPEYYNRKDIVLVVDLGTWYVYLGDASDTDNNGWYLQD